MTRFLSFGLLLAIALIGVSGAVMPAALAQEPDLSDLSPQQRRAVERMQAQGVTVQSVEGVTGNGASQQRGPLDYSRAILATPDFAPVAGDGLVAINLIPAGTAGAGSPWLTFGQAFAPGDLLPDQPLAILAEDHRLPVQRDIKALHDDGSVRHAVLTADLSALAPRRHQALIVKAASDPVPEPGGAAVVTAPVRVSISGVRDDGGPFSGALDLDAAGSGETWLSGPLVRERTVTKDIGPLLTLRADERVYADGRHRTRIVFENHKTFAPGARDMTYRATIGVGGETLTFDTIRHYRGANWSQVVHDGGEPSFTVEHDPAYLARALAILPFDLSIGVAAGAIERHADILGRQRDVLPPGLLETYFPAAGGRPDIGPLPAWDVLYLKSQAPAARDVMMRMAETAGSVPWHFEDEKTGFPVRVDRRPLFWAEERGADEWRGEDRIPPAYFEGRNGGFSLDTAHKPLLSYTAYLVTGDAYHARELRHEAAFAIAMIWPEKRMGEAVVTEELQLRGRAWALRDVAAAAWLLPDEDPLKDYFNTARERSLSHMVRAYLEEGRLDAAGETEGWFEDLSYSIDGGTPPWQNDYMVIILAQEALRGSVEAGRLVSWAENYQAGRFLDTGADPEFGASYVHIVSDPVTDEPQGSWAQMLMETMSGEGYTESFPDYGAGYVASAYAALSMSHYVTGSDRSRRALGALASTQEGSGLFDPANDSSVFVLPQFTLTIPGTE